jgi:peptide/nickel transport system substrate-binding protein
VSRRAFLAYGVLPVAGLGVLAACTPAPPPAPAATQAPAGGQAPAPAATSAPAAAQPAQATLSVPQSITTPAPATAAAQPAATTAPAAATGVQPKGKLTYVWHTTISPAWFDPQENPPQITPYNFAYALHDALVKHCPARPSRQAWPRRTRSLRTTSRQPSSCGQNIKFHDGSAITPEDVKFTYEKYRGANAGILHDKLQEIQIPDNRTIKFLFKEPFLDFLTIYGSPSSGAGWIVPKAYYEKVGKDGFKTAPIGAGPYRFVKQAGRHRGRVRGVH